MGFHTQTKFIYLGIHRCKACWKCVEQCPEKVFKKTGFLLERHAIVDNPEPCIGCKRCEFVCQSGAIASFNDD